MKTKRIYIDKKKVVEAEKGIIVALVNDNKTVKINIIGELLFEEAIDSLNTAMLDILRNFYDAAKTIHKDLDPKTVQEEIYNRAVLGFSLMVDQFYPEGKSNRFAGFTEEAILKAQNDMLKERSKNEKTSTGSGSSS